MPTCMTCGTPIDAACLNGDGIGGFYCDKQCQKDHEPRLAQLWLEKMEVASAEILKWMEEDEHLQ